MSKSKLPVWVNPTRNSDWDDYYLVVTPLAIIVILFVLLILGAATVNTIRGVK